MIFKLCVRNNETYPTEYEQKGTRKGIGPGMIVEIMEVDFLPNEFNNDLLKRGILSIINKISIGEEKVNLKKISDSVSSSNKKKIVKEDS